MWQRSFTIGTDGCFFKEKLARKVGDSRLEALSLVKPRTMPFGAKCSKKLARKSSMLTSYQYWEEKHFVTDIPTGIWWNIR